MNFTPITTPKVVKSLFPSLIWSIPTKDKSIYLTFDDGPTPNVTHWVLDVLKQFNAKATFFCIGKNIEEHPDIFQRILKEGHVVGNHTYNHLKGWKTSVDSYLMEVIRTQEVIKSQNQKPEIRNQNLFRPPYGQITPKQIKQLHKLNYKIVMWDTLSVDWDGTISKEKCLKNVINHANSGSIIVLHDSVKASKNMMYVLPKVLKHFTEMGYTFKHIPV